MTTKVDQPRAQPDSYMPHDGLRVWLDEYERCVREIDIFRECGGTDINYQENLRWARDAAAARLAGYAARVLDAPKRGGNDA
ncbi:MAG: hypothetical protein ACRDTZ_17640 [Pseudonocardiaceae bacterium]